MRVFLAIVILVEFAFILRESVFRQSVKFAINISRVLLARKDTGAIILANAGNQWMQVKI